jgi:phosphohistidine phosphatase
MSGPGDSGGAGVVGTRRTVVLAASAACCEDHLMERSVEHREGRRLVLLRHAKSQRPPGLDDHARPLSRRGLRDAQTAGLWLAERGLVPDLVLCSGAARARATWQSAAEGIPARERGDIDVRYEPRLYEASVSAVVNLAAETVDDVGTLLVVGHEPTISAVAGVLAGPGSDEALVAEVRAHLPTTGIVVLRQDGRWGDLQSGSAALIALEAPRG